MMTARVFAGASLFALLIVETCCVPVKKGASYGGSYMDTAPDYGSNYGASYGQFSPGAPGGDFSPSYQPVPQVEPSFSQPAVQRQPAPSVGPSFPAGQPGSRSSSVREIPASSSQPGPAFQPDQMGLKWSVPVPSFFSGGEEVSSGTRAVGSSRPENVSPPLPPPGPVYQGGELSRYEQTIEDGNSESETEEQGYLPPPPFPAVEESSGEGFTSQPEPVPTAWDIYPYYDYMFLTGQYPPGTVTHSSSSFEQGNDHFQDKHYERYYAPYSAAPAQQMETFATEVEAPQTYAAPVVADYGKGGSQLMPRLGNYGNDYMQPYRSRVGRYKGRH